jgi:hypothetical protein
MVLETVREKRPVLRHLPAALDRKEYFGPSDLVVKTIQYSSDDGESVSDPLVGVLNCPSLEPRARAMVWELLGKCPPDISEFTKVYKRKDDFVELVEFLATRPDPAAKPLLLEAVRSSIVAFSKGYELLEQIGADEIFEPGFVSTVLTLDFQNEPETIIRYLRSLFARNSGEQGKLLRPIVERTRMRIGFLNSVLEDLAALSAEDISPLFGLLQIVRELGKLHEIGEESMKALKAKLHSPEVLERIQLPQLAQLATLLPE